MTTTAVGQPTGGKPINLGQLEAELVVAQVAVGTGVGLADDYVFAYTAAGAPTDFRANQRATVDQVIAAHVARRDKTNDEYVDEFQTADAARQLEINHIVTGLLPRDQVPITEGGS